MPSKSEKPYQGALSSVLSLNLSDNPFRNIKETADQVQCLMPSVTDLQISLFDEMDVDYIIQAMPQLQYLNNLRIAREQIFAEQSESNYDTADGVPKQGGTAQSETDAVEASSRINLHGKNSEDSRIPYSAKNSSKPVDILIYQQKKQSEPHRESDFYDLDLLSDKEKMSQQNSDSQAPKHNFRQSVQSFGGVHLQHELDHDFQGIDCKPAPQEESLSSPTKD